MRLNKDGFHILAESEWGVDVVTRFSPTQKMEFPGIAALEFKITPKYGPQLIQVGYGAEGKWPIVIEPPYTIDRPRQEIPIPSAQVLSYLYQIKANVNEAIRMCKDWEIEKGLR